MIKNEKLTKKLDFRKILGPIWDLALKRVSKFVIPKFRDTLLVPKIMKCGDLLYNVIITLGLEKFSFKKQKGAILQV